MIFNYGDSVTLKNTDPSDTKNHSSLDDSEPTITESLWLNQGTETLMKGNALVGGMADSESGIAAIIKTNKDPIPNPYTNDFLFTDILDRLED